MPSLAWQHLSMLTQAQAALQTRLTMAEVMPGQNLIEIRQAGSPMGDELQPGEGEGRGAQRLHIQQCASYRGQV